MIRYMTLLGGLVAAVAVAGCAGEAPVDTSKASPQASAEGKQYLLASAPEGAQEVVAVRESIGDDEEVVIVGRIGGSQDPWVEGRAAFSIVDRSLPACTDIPGDTCPTPWDYCCATDKLPAATTLVKLVDDQGELVSTDARELLGLDELQTVTVTGKAQRDEEGNVTILARSIYVDPTNPGQVGGDHDHEGHDHDGHDHDHDHGHDHEDHDHEGAEKASPAADEHGDS